MDIQQKLYPHPITLEAAHRWRQGNDAEYRFYDAAKVAAIHDELAAIHIRDDELDEILQRDQEEARFRQLSEHQRSYDAGWITIADIQTLGERLAVLANQVPQ